MDEFLNDYIFNVVANAKRAREQAERDYGAAVADLRSAYEAQREMAWKAGTGKIPSPPFVPPPPKSAAKFAATVRANPLVARAYPKIAGFDVERDDNEGELAITIVDEDGEVLGRYVGIRG